jgi:hypothetical protein
MTLLIFLSYIFLSDQSYISLRLRVLEGSRR